MKKIEKGVSSTRIAFQKRKGLSTVISTVILLVGISIMGLLGISWANSNLALNEKSLGDTYNNHVNQMKESIAPQHEFFNSANKQLNVTFVNTGIDGLQIREIIINGTNKADLKIIPPANVTLGGTFSQLVNYDWAVDSNGTIHPIDISLISNRGSIFTHQLQVPTDGQLIIKKIAKQADGNFSYYGDLGNFYVQTAGHKNNANLDSNGNLVVSGIIRDFNSSSWVPGGDPDFEKPCGYCPFGLITGIVLPNLGSDGEPVYNNSTTSAFNNGFARFYQWYHDDPTANKGKQLNITLLAQGTNPQTWKYSNMSFFPIDNQLFQNNGLNHNFGFTYEIHSQFTYQGGETFTFWGDDDVWLFINNKLAHDLGGVHSGLPFTTTLDSTTANSLGITPGGVYNFDFFYAERHTTQSEIQITTSIKLGTPGTGNSGVFFVDPGVYNVGETIKPGWAFQSVTCDHGQLPLTNSSYVQVTVPKGVTTCTFTNIKN